MGTIDRMHDLIGVAAIRFGRILVEAASLDADVKRAGFPVDDDPLRLRFLRIAGRHRQFQHPHRTRADGAIARIGQLKLGEARTGALTDKYVRAAIDRTRVGGEPVGRMLPIVEAEDRGRDRLRGHVSERPVRRIDAEDRERVVLPIRGDGQVNRLAVKREAVNDIDVIVADAVGRDALHLVAGEIVDLEPGILQRRHHQAPRGVGGVDPDRRVIGIGFRCIRFCRVAEGEIRRFHTGGDRWQGVDIDREGQKLGRLRAAEIVVAQHEQALPAIGELRTESHGLKIVERDTEVSEIEHQALLSDRVDIKAIELGDRADIRRRLGQHLVKLRRVANAGGKAALKRQ